jgi:tetratricopeptide (TPR) repeat protein
VLKKLHALPSEPLAAAALRSLLGETQEATSADEIAWAFRKLLEEQAPLICVFDDIQWGEETFLDLVEQVALLSSKAAILLLCMGRPELVDRRSTWPVTLRLEPLVDTEVEELIPRTIGEEQRAQIARAAGGNPLFIAEMLAMREEGNGDVAVPPTLQALLASRLDQLESSERRVLECGAVEGEIFHRGAVRALAHEERRVTTRLTALVRRELIRPDATQIPDDDGFRFRHLLIRDAAYNSLAKSTRADLHERYADWLEEHGSELVELDEIMGYHLEQAVRYRQELGRVEASTAKRAGERLAAAGRQARSRGDLHAAASLLERALILTRPLGLDVTLELDLAEALLDPRAAGLLVKATADRASAEGDVVAEALARAVAAEYDLSTGKGGVEDLERLARAALPMLAEAGDNVNLARMWGALGHVAGFHGRYAEATHAQEQSLRHMRLAGQRPAGVALAIQLVSGPRAADAAVRTLDELVPEGRHQFVIQMRATLLAMLGRFGEARRIANEAATQLRELTGEDDVGGEWLAYIAEFAGDYESAARHMRQFCGVLERRGHRSVLSTYAPMLGRYLCILGLHDEAESLAELGRDLGDEDDVMTQIVWRQVQARVFAARGAHVNAKALAKEAVAIAERTDGLNMQGAALCDLAEVLTVAGRPDEAAEVFEEALDRYERKKNLAMVAQVRPRLEELRTHVT